MTRETWLWTLVAGLALVWSMVAAAMGGGLLLPILVCGLAGGCAASEATRRRVDGWLAYAFSGRLWRTAIIVAGALMLIQLLPLELAVLMAGDILVYLEAVAAVSLIAASTRLKAVMADMENRVRPMLRTLRPRLTPGGRRATRRPARRPAPDDDAEGPGFAWAI